MEIQTSKKRVWGISMAATAEKEASQLAEALNDLFTNVSTMVKGEIQVANVSDYHFMFRK